MNNEEKLYKLIESIDTDNINGLGFGIHESSMCETRFPKDEYGYRVYHKDGYCFDITWERQFDEEENEIEPHYEYIEGVFDGFKALSIEKAIEIIEKEGVFL